ncbi:hypothetical protein FAGKG844_10200 [Frankia sp. AgKG'84/4]
MRAATRATLGGSPASPPAGDAGATRTPSSSAPTSFSAPTRATRPDLPRPRPRRDRSGPPVPASEDSDRPPAPVLAREAEGGTDGGAVTRTESTEEGWSTKRCSSAMHQ